MDENTKRLANNVKNQFVEAATQEAIKYLSQNAKDLLANGMDEIKVDDKLITTIRNELLDNYETITTNIKYLYSEKINNFVKECSENFDKLSDNDRTAFLEIMKSRNEFQRTLIENTNVQMQTSKGGIKKVLAGIGIGLGSALVAAIVYALNKDDN